MPLVVVTLVEQVGYFTSSMLDSYHVFVASCNLTLRIDRIDGCQIHWQLRQFAEPPRIAILLIPNHPATHVNIRRNQIFVILLHVAILS